MSAQSWRPQVTGDDWMRDQERRLLHEERRPKINKASDLVGPGIGAYAVKLLDWNSEVARFNGWWFCEPDTPNAPEPGVQFVGMTIAVIEGHFEQVAISHDDAPHRIYVRRVHRHVTSSPQYGTWEPIHPAVPTGAVIFIPTAQATPTGWTDAAYTAPTGLRAISRS